jgi:hypothetical protein
MATSQPGLTVALGIEESYPNPTAQWGTVANSVQIQNSSAFVIQVTAGGETYVIQPFVAQTLTLGASGGAPINIEGLSSPSGLETNQLTLIWLLRGEGPPMQDGPLTAAALIAAALPPGLVYGPTATAGGDVVITQTAPSNTRTLILVITGTFINPVENISGITILGTTTNELYYDQLPYLAANEGLSAQVVCPVNGAADTAYEITITAAPPPLNPWTYALYADTDQYPESIFYNGPYEASSADVNGAIVVSGPCRLASLLVSWITATNVGVNYNPATGGPVSLFSISPANASGACPISLPPNFILPAGASISMTLGNGEATVAAIKAYP